MYHQCHARFCNFIILLLKKPFKNWLNICILFLSLCLQKNLFLSFFHLIFRGIALKTIYCDHFCILSYTKVVEYDFYEFNSLTPYFASLNSYRNNLAFDLKFRPNLVFENLPLVFGVLNCTKVYITYIKNDNFDLIAQSQFRFKVTYAVP